MEVEHLSSEWFMTQMRLETQLVLICWETYSVNPQCYHPKTLKAAQELAAAKVRVCKQVVLQFWEHGILYAQQSARTEKQAERLGGL